MTTCDCDVCDTEIEIEEFETEFVTCPKCGARYEVRSEYLDSSSGSWTFMLDRIDAEKE